MLSTILVPLDGSALSERAIPYAEALARPRGARLVFMRAVLTANASTPGAFSYNWALRDQAQEYLSSFVGEARARGLNAEPLVWDDEAGRAISKAAAAEGADMIVMSIHGRSGLARVVWGSVANRVLRRAAAPILLVPRNADAHSFRNGSTRVLVPLDGSFLAEQAIAPARELARALGAEMVLVRAVDPNTWMMADDSWPVYDSTLAEVLDSQVQNAQSYLQGVAATIAEPGLPVRTDVVQDRAAPALRRAAREHQASAIVMATHGRSGVNRLLMGSVTDAVLRSAHVPVLVVRPAAVRLEHEAMSVRRPPPPERTLTLSMSGEELGLTKEALRHLLNSSRGGKTMSRALALLTRMEQVEAGPTAAEPEAEKVREVV